MPFHTAVLCYLCKEGYVFMLCLSGCLSFSRITNYWPHLNEILWTGWTQIDWSLDDVTQSWDQSMRFWVTLSHVHSKIKM